MCRIPPAIAGSAKFGVLIVLGAICMVISVICLPSIGLGVLLLSEQVAGWVRTAQWHSVTLSDLFMMIGYDAHAKWSSSQAGFERLLALEGGLMLIVMAVLLWLIALGVFDLALRRWRARAF